MNEWPGQDLGCPREGSGSLAPLSLRAFALAIDWVVATLVVKTLGGLELGAESMAILGMFVAEMSILGMTLGGSFGHIVMGLRVRGLTGPVPWWKHIVRSVLIALVIPAVFMDENNRGLHDRVIVTALVRK